MRRHRVPAVLGHLAAGDSGAVLVFFTTVGDLTRFLRVLQLAQVRGQLSIFFHALVDHAQLPRERRLRTALEWADPHGGTRALVASPSYINGVHRPDVARLFNWGAPVSLTATVQAAGRGGRDGTRTAHATFFVLPAAFCDAHTRPA